MVFLLLSIDCWSISDNELSSIKVIFAIIEKSSEKFGNNLQTILHETRYPSLDLINVLYFEKLFLLKNKNCFIIYECSFINSGPPGNNFSWKSWNFKSEYEYPNFSRKILVKYVILKESLLAKDITNGLLIMKQWKSFSNFS